MPAPKRFNLGIDREYRNGIVDTVTGHVVDLTCYYNSRPSSETLTVNVWELVNLLNKIHEQGEEMWNQEAIDRQNNEFDAVTRLMKEWKILQQVAVVDDDYPYVRGHYESAMKDLIIAIKKNGRID